MIKKVVSTFLILTFSLIILVSCSMGNGTNKNSTTDDNIESNISSTNEDQDVSFDVIFKNYDDTVLDTQRVKKGTIPTYNKSNPIRIDDDNYKYTFSGWLPEITIVTRNITYVAQYNKIELPYTISFDLDGGTSNSNVTNIKIEKLTKDKFRFDIVKPKYVFKGWSCNGLQVFDEQGNIVNNISLQSNMIFKAMYEEAVQLTITYSVYNSKTETKIETFNTKPFDIGNVSESKIYHWNTLVKLVSKPNEGYKFVGWYCDGIQLSSEDEFDYMIWEDDVILDARFEYDTYELEISSYDTDFGQIMIKQGNSQNWYNEQKQKQYYTELTTVAAYTKTNKEFLGWYDETNKLVSSSAVYTFVMPKRNYKLEAKWNYFYINYDLDGGINDSNNPNYYSFDIQNIRLREPRKEGYVFQGWEYEGNVITEINIANTCHMNIKALWKESDNTPYRVEHYLQNIDDDNYSTTPYEIDYLMGTTNTLTNGSVKTYEGFISPSITQVNIDSNGKTLIKLYYERKKYDLLLNNSDVNSGEIVDISDIYKFGKQLTINAESKTGYSFSGWYDGNNNLISTKESYTFNMPATNLVYTAKWLINQYSIIINNETDGVIISGVTSGDRFDFNSQIKLNAVNIPLGYTIKWARNDGIIEADDNYTFRVPAIDLIITISTCLYKKQGNRLLFGTYPQTLVTDKTLIIKLNELAGQIPTSTNLYKWTDYNYYIDDNVTSYMYYQDIDYDNNGSYDYRGVYFNQYRPYSYSLSSRESSSRQDDNGYTTNTIYWFRYEPVEWNILKEENGKIFIISNLILDSQAYQEIHGYSSTSTSTFYHNGNWGYSNDYKLSDIRKFLNETFYNTAFDELQRDLIETTIVDNSVESTQLKDNERACENTEDKLFLLSCKEANTYFTSDITRYAQGTAYAKCQGLIVTKDESYLGNSLWLLRSPEPYDFIIVVVQYAGDLDIDDDRYNFYGVRPACWINL